MLRILALTIGLTFAVTGAVAQNKSDAPRRDRGIGAHYTKSMPERADISSLPPDIRARVRRPSLIAAAADTFHLAWFSFDSLGEPDKQGWISVDMTAQQDTFFHVAGPDELSGGTFGRLLPVTANVHWRVLLPIANHGVYADAKNGLTKIVLFCNSR